MGESTIEYRPLAVAELARIGEIDRTERIDAVYAQLGTELQLRIGDPSAPQWSPEGDGEHSVAAQHASLERYVEQRAVLIGAFACAIHFDRERVRVTHGTAAATLRQRVSSARAVPARS